MTSSLRLTLLAGAAFLAACSQLPTYERPPVDLPAQFAAGGAQAGKAADLRWQDFVGDAGLRHLVQVALDNNRDLRVATLQMEQAQAQFQVRRADPFPTVGLQAAGNRQPNGNGGIASTYSVGLAISAWEIDFFGRIASLREAALAQYLATEEGRKAAQISLVSAVGSAWLDVQSADLQLALTRQTLATREDSLRLTRLRFDRGTNSALDLRQAESLTESARATLAQQQRARQLAINALNVLVGRPVAASELPAGQAALAGFADVPVGVPSDVLLARPDIRAAEQQLVAANAQIGAARAAFFPRITLTAGVGTASTSLSGLFKDGSWGFTLAPQLLLPIFDAGRNQANLDSAQVGQKIAVAQYEKAIQTAFREVADALAGEAALADQLKAQQALETAERERARLSDLRLQQGVASALEALDAQRSLFAAQQAVVSARVEVARNRLALYKALGGGWSADS